MWMMPKTVDTIINIINPKWVCYEGNVYYNILSTHIWNFVKGHVRRWGHDSFPLAYNITRNLLSCHMVPLRAGPSALPLDQATRSAQVQSQYATPLNVTNLCQATTYSWQLTVVLTVERSALLNHTQTSKEVSRTVNLSHSYPKYNQC
jgi:hypothetical protein